VTRVFVLSPASCHGERARLLFDERAAFAAARQLRSPDGIALGEVFAFLSGLYFRGKLAYGRAFARPPAGAPGVVLITSCEGLRTPDERVSLGQLQRYARVPIEPGEPRYRRPLLRDAQRVAAQLGPDAEVVLLGSVASAKYVEPLAEVFQDRLRFPVEFVGRGDMSRGGLLLRCVAEERELAYVPVVGAVRRGRRPPRLVPQQGIFKRAVESAHWTSEVDPSLAPPGPG
jgi:hypothetical protein